MRGCDCVRRQGIHMSVFSGRIERAERRLGVDPPCSGGKKVIEGQMRRVNFTLFLFSAPNGTVFPQS